MTRRGLFITLEGGEGAGKSTLLQGIHRWLVDAQGIEPLLTREPGGTALGESIRALVLDAGQSPICAASELLLMFASRAQLVREVLEPALERGQVVLCDRFTDASYAYQGGGRGEPRQRIGELERWAARDLQPDLTLLLDLAPDLGRQRIAARNAPDRIEAEATPFFERVRAAYRARADEAPQRFCLIDAAQSADQVLAQACQAIALRLQGWRA